MGVSLPALHDAWVGSYLADSERIFSLIDTLQAPFHVINPLIAAKNMQDFCSVFAEFHCKGTVYYGKKANKSSQIIRAITTCSSLLPAGITRGVDVASEQEFMLAISEGIAGTDLIVTGPAKTDALYLLAAEYNALLTIDSPLELAYLSALGITHQRIHVRLAPLNSLSRFGMDEKTLFSTIIACGEHHHRCEGISFHCRGYSMTQRRREAKRAIHIVNSVRASAPMLSKYLHRIDMGGGFPISYVSQQSWENFLNAYSVEQIQFLHNKKFSNFYPYHNQIAGPAALAELISEPGIDDAYYPGIPVMDLCAQHDIGLAIEPGRALLDQVGFSVFPILSVDPCAGSNTFRVTVQGTSFSLSEQWFGSEFLPDPQLLLRNNRRDRQHNVNNSFDNYCDNYAMLHQRTPQLQAMEDVAILDNDHNSSFGSRNNNDSDAAITYPIVVVANTCLEEDVLTWREIDFPVLPRRGDALIYHNTAAYQMDSNESTFHSTPLPHKIVVSFDESSHEWNSYVEGVLL